MSKVLFNSRCLLRFPAVQPEASFAPFAHHGASFALRRANRANRRGAECVRSAGGTARPHGVASERARGTGVRPRRRRARATRGIVFLRWVRNDPTRSTRSTVTLDASSSSVCVIAPSSGRRACYDLLQCCNRSLLRHASRTWRVTRVCGKRHDLKV
jgi:hypothetical protein